MKHTTCSSFGPWFVALLINTTDDNTRTELVPHTYPHLMVDVLNTKHANQVWVVLMKVGPFERWSECVSYSQAWSSKTRGRAARIEKGIRLWREQHSDKTLWIQTRDKDSLTDAYRESKRARKESDGEFLQNMRIYSMRSVVLQKKE